MNDLNLVARADTMSRVQGPGDDRPVDLDGYGPLGQPQVIDETADRDLVRHVARCAIDGDPHARKLSPP
jgi:hypothetical protein